MDDQQARDVAAKAIARIAIPTITGRYTNLHIANAAIDAYLAALPVAPEQPTQALTEEEVRNSVADWNHRLASSILAAAVVLWLAENDLAVVPRAALVSSPSVETVTPDKETIVREVIEWFAHQKAFGGVGWVSKAGLEAVREHFGVSS